MIRLTRRRDPDRTDCWHIFHTDVRVGTIARRSGCPVDVDQFEWSCGFHGVRPGDQTNGTAPTYEACRADFLIAWESLLPRLTEADFDAWREQRDWTEQKYEMWERGEKLPSQKPSTLIRCPCGVTFDSHKLEDSLVHVPHITEAHGGDVIRR